MTREDSIYTTLKETEFSGLMLEESTVAPRVSVPPEIYEKYCLCFLLEGESTETRSRRTYYHEAPSLTVNIPGDSQSFRVGRTELRFLSIEIPAEWLENRASSLLQIPSVIDSRDQEHLSLFGKIYREFRSFDEFSQAAIEGLLLETLVLAARGGGEKISASRFPAWIRRARELIRDDPDSSHTLSSVAAALRVHPAHLARVFRLATGATIGEFVRKTRVERARQKMLTTDMPLAQIALEAGFCDQAHFSRVFKQIVGASPKKYKDACSIR